MLVPNRTSRKRNVPSCCQGRGAGSSVAARSARCRMPAITFRCSMPCRCALVAAPQDAEALAFLWPPLPVAVVPGRIPPISHPGACRNVIFVTGSGTVARSRDRGFPARPSRAKSCDLRLLARLHVALASVLLAFTRALGYARAAGSADRRDLCRRSGGVDPLDRPRTAGASISSRSLTGNILYQRLKLRPRPIVRSIWRSACAFSRARSLTRSGFVGSVLRVLWATFGVVVSKFGRTRRRAAGVSFLIVPAANPCSCSLHRCRDNCRSVARWQH